MAFITDIFVGALSTGVNHPTFIVLNVICAFAVLSLLGLLASSFKKYPELTPHVVVLLLFAFGLWASVNFVISQLGLVDAKEQQKELFGDGRDSAAAALEGDEQLTKEGESEEKKEK